MKLKRIELIGIVLFAIVCLTVKAQDNQVEQGQKNCVTGVASNNNMNAAFVELDNGFVYRIYGKMRWDNKDIGKFVKLEGVLVVIKHEYDYNNDTIGVSNYNWAVDPPRYSNWIEYRVINPKWEFVPSKRDTICN